MSKHRGSLSSVHQLPLLFHLHEKHTFENFYPGPNTVALSCLKQLIKERNLAHTIYLWGHPFVGCSHLLNAFCESSKAEGLKSLYLSLETIQKQYQPFELHHLAQNYDFVCFDDIEVIGGQMEWEKALFALYNQLVQSQTPILFSAHQVPFQLPFILPDLVSRLNSGLLFQIRELNDTEKIAALQLRAFLRGLELPENVAQFLLSRLSRSARALLEALNQLDSFVSVRKRKLTLPFVKEILDL